MNMQILPIPISGDTKHVGAPLFVKFILFEEGYEGGVFSTKKKITKRWEELINLSTVTRIVGHLHEDGATMVCALIRPDYGDLWVLGSLEEIQKKIEEATK